MSRTLRTIPVFVQIALMASFTAMSGPAHASGDGHMEHDMSHGMHGDEQALQDLFPMHAVTHIAVQNGLWNDPNTWSTPDAPSDPTVPGDRAIVHIPAGIKVDFEHIDEAHLFMVQVDGHLEFPGDEPTHMIFDTLIVGPDGQLEINANGPRSADVDLEIRQTDIDSDLWNTLDALNPETECPEGAAEDTEDEDEPPNPDRFLDRRCWDPKQLSLGIISQGRTQLLGKEKTARVALHELDKSKTSLELAEVPTDWKRGDVIVVTATNYVPRTDSGKSDGSQDEVRRIARITGSTVYFVEPLEYDHSPPRDDLNTYVVNLTRNVRIHSTASIPSSNPISADEVGSKALEFGHVMFMHNDDVAIQFVHFDDLGRTNKNQILDDFKRNPTESVPNLNTDRTLDEDGNWEPAPDDVITNRRGRYAVHFHRAGVDSLGGARVEGSVVTEGPGWGFVSHDSHVDFVENVTYGVLGAGFVAETGNETGSWAGNTAIYTYGAEFNGNQFTTNNDHKYLVPTPIDPVPPPDDDGDPCAPSSPRDGDYLPDDGDADQKPSTDGTMVLDKRGAWKNQDMGHFGTGFWFQGKLIDATDNVSVSSGLTGYFFIFRGPDQENVFAHQVETPLSIHSPNGIHPLAPGLNVFEGNESIADTRGLDMIGTGAGRTNDERSMIRDFTAWEVGDVGTHAEYYPGYTIRDSTFIASENPAARTGEGVYWRRVQLDTVLANLEIVGFDRPYRLQKKWSCGTIDHHGFQDPETIMADPDHPNPLPLGYAHLLVDVGFDAEEAMLSENLGEYYDDRSDWIYSSTDDLVTDRFDITFDDDSLVIELDHALERTLTATDVEGALRPSMQDGYVLMLRGTKTDSIGEIPLMYHNNRLVWHEDAVQHRLLTKGYYVMPNGLLAVELEELFSDRYTGAKHVKSFLAWLDPDWPLTDDIEGKDFDPAALEGVYIPAFLLDTSSTRLTFGPLEPFVDSLGRYWPADPEPVGDDKRFTPHNVISGTQAPEVYYGKWFGPAFAQDIDLDAGFYDVTLHFVETKDVTHGDREMLVAVDDIAQTYDMTGRVGYLDAQSASTLTFPSVPVFDDPLHIAVSEEANSTLPATISAIEVRPVVRISAGDTTGFTDDHDQWWGQDISNSGKFSHKVTPITTNEDPSIFYGKRYGDALTYSVDTPRGYYDVKLHFVEPRANVAVGQRRMNVRMEGTPVLTDFDITAVVGGNSQYVGVTETIQGVWVGDDALDIEVLRAPGSLRPATISAIEILPPTP